MNTSENNNIKQPPLDNDQQPIKLKTTILYSDLTDNTPIISSNKLPDNTESNTTTETYQIISAQFSDQPTTSNVELQQANTTLSKVENKKPSENLDTDRQVTSGLHREHNSKSLTDDTILQQSHQLTMTQDDKLEDDKTATGVAVEHMDVVLKQWYLTVQWQRTMMPKSGWYNKFKKNTQPMDLDLSCLLCNRYGEVIETVWFKNVRDKAESVRHQGDELVGKRPVSLADDRKDESNGKQTVGVNDAKLNQESIVIYLNKLPPQVFHVVMIVSSYYGDPLAKAKEALCQLSDDEGNVISELAFSKLSNDTKAVWFASLTRSADSWRYNTEHQPLGNSDMASIEQYVSENLVRTAR